MAIKDRKKTRFNRIGVIRLGYKVFWCKDGHKSYPTRWLGESRQACEKCGKVRTGLSERSGVSPYQPGHFVLRDAPDILEFYARQDIEEKDIRELDVMFPFAERDKNFIANYQVWAGGDCVCQGDGEFVEQARPLKACQDAKGWHIKKEPGATLVNNGIACRAFNWNGTDFAEGDHVMCSGSSEERLYPHCHMCKLNSMLKVMMSDLDLFRLGYYRIATGSGRNYDHLDTMFGQFLPENVQGIYFKLRLVEEATQYTDDDGQTRKTMKWFLHLEPEKGYIRDLFKQRAARQIGQVGTEEILQLEAKQDDPAADEYVIEEPEYIQSGDGIPSDNAKPRPDFSGWKPKQWTTFCRAVTDAMDCFSDTKSVWSLIKGIHGNPPEASYDEAWTTCEDHDSAPMTD